MPTYNVTLALGDPAPLGTESRRIGDGNPRQVLDEITHLLYFELKLNVPLHIHTYNEIVLVECLSWGLDHPGCLRVFVEGVEAPLDKRCRLTTPAVEQYFEVLGERRRAIIAKRRALGEE